MPGSTWPWTPSSGLVAGRTFKNNHDYRIALEEAARARSRMWRAESQLTAALEAMDKPAGIYWAIMIPGMARQPHRLHGEESGCGRLVRHPLTSNYPTIWRRRGFARAAALLKAW